MVHRATRIVFNAKEVAITSYKTLKAEIAKLDKQAEGVCKNELKSLVAQVKQTIREHGLTARDLGLMTRAATSSGQAKTGRVRQPGLLKYMDPKTRNTWTDHGKPPGWTVNAKNRDAFLIDPAPTSARAASMKKAGARVASKAPGAAKTAGSGLIRRRRAAASATGASVGRGASAH